MKISSILYGTKANGPGLRACVWVQGCSILCPGCINPHTHSFDGGQKADPDDLAKHIIEYAHPGVDGVTLSGGEPMSQAISVYSLICSIHAYRPNWSVGLFSGYTLTELITGQYDLREPLHLDTPGIRSLLWTDQIKPHLDWSVTGRYDRSRPPKGFCSSANQHLLIYRRYQYEDFEPLKEVLIGEDGLTQITGVLS